MRRVTILGPQRFTPTLGEAVAAAGVTGRLASVTAGWQEREAEDRELHEHLAERTVNLMLYARSEEVFARDSDLFRAHRARQDRLRELQELYRVRLGHLLDAVRELDAREGEPAILAPEREAALEAVRDLDRRHLGRIGEIHADFEREARPATRPSIARHREEIERLLEGTEAIGIAGGHVAVLVNRLRLFGLDRAIGARAVFAWSAGAMAIADRVVVFHDFPPQGRGHAEVLEAGLGLAPGFVPLPHAHRRLALDDRRGLALFARRFAPARAIALADGGWLALGAGAANGGAREIAADGELAEVAAA